jgi:preprotein translocase subunit SecF
MFKIIENTKIWFTLSLLIIAIGMGFWIVKGLNYGIDFAGGTVLQVDLKHPVKTEEIMQIREIASKYANDAQVSTVDNTGVVIRSSVLSGDQGNKIEQLKKDVSEKYNVDIKTWTTETVGPSIGNELKQKALLSLFTASAAILVYVALRFELKSGVAAVLALLHDVLITLSVYSILQIPVNSSFIAAILTVIGYSINDTIVIFDRIRENMKTMRHVSYEELADVSLTQTMSRSINTGMSTLFTITAVYFIGVSSVKELALPLIVGIISGCYSSIFIATPIWVIWKNHDKKNKEIVRANA